MLHLLLLAIHDPEIAMRVGAGDAPLSLGWHVLTDCEGSPCDAQHLEQAQSNPQAL